MNRGMAIYALKTPGPLVRELRADGAITQAALRTPEYFAGLGSTGHAEFSVGPAINRYRGTQAEFQFSIVSPQTEHSKLAISRSSTICSLRS